MSETDISQAGSSESDDKARAMLLGVSLGAICGLIGSYLYTRAAAEHDRENPGAPRSISTGQALAIFLSILGVVRQVAELGKPKKPKKQ